MISFIFSISSHGMGGYKYMGVLLIIGLFMALLTNWHKRSQITERETDQHIRELGLVHRDMMRKADNEVAAFEHEVNSLRRDIRDDERYIRQLRLRLLELEEAKDEEE